MAYMCLIEAHYNIMGTTYNVMDTNVVLMSPIDIAMHQFEQVLIYKSNGESHRFNVIPLDSIHRGHMALPDHVRRTNHFHLTHKYFVHGCHSSTLTKKTVVNVPKIGILGQDKAIHEIMWSVFEPRKLSRKSRSELNLQVVRGIILYGPPGTGKTSMIRGICKYLEIVPHVIHGPELLNEYIGKSESNIRELFFKPITDQKNFGDESPLHVIVLHEMDALFMKRSTLSNNTNNNDTVVAQMLAMMDGYTQLDNYVIFGTTNRLDVIDPALLRSGRFERKIKIDPLNAQARFDLLSFFTNALQVNARLASDVNEAVLVHIAKTAINYTGAELKQLVQHATQLAITRVAMDSETDVNGKRHIDETKIIVRLSDIAGAFQMRNQQSDLPENKEIAGLN